MALLLLTGAGRFNNLGTRVGCRARIFITAKGSGCFRQFCKATARRNAPWQSRAGCP